MKRCIPCAALADDIAPTCANCGEASWQPIVKPDPSLTAIAEKPASVEVDPAQDTPESAPVAADVPAPVLTQPTASPGGHRWRKGNR